MQEDQSLKNMIVLLSPAKIQDFKPEAPLHTPSNPAFIAEAEELVSQVRRLSISALAELLKVNPSLARLNAERFAQWHLPFTTDNAKAAVQVYNGEVFHGLDIRTMQAVDRAYLNDHLRLFSGLYGLLKPFDLIQPYRLDIGDRFTTESGQNMYAYWREKLTASLNKTLKEQGSQHVLNLASGEYIKGIDRKKIKGKIIDVDFLQMEPNGYKTIVIYTKKARGMMTRFVVENRIEDPEHLKGFDAEGYWYNQDLSKPGKMVFTR